MNVRKLYVFAHTHWDREWYQPFEAFRLQLVSVVRQVLDELESGRLPKFYLDGQSIILDDVLELAPDLRPRLEALMRNGKLSAGPWYVLADQMLVGGESLIRNLAIGLEKTSKFGPPAMIGYCPDTFGHSQDLPRILNGFGIKTAAVWRGVPLLQMGPAFWWTSPDGSRVLAYHLTHGYYQTLFHEAAGNGTTAGDGDSLAPLVDNLLPWLDLAPTNGTGHAYYKVIDGALLPVGADHVGPPKNLSSVLKHVNNELQKQPVKCSVVPTTLAEFMDLVSQRLKKPMTVVWSVDGELRSNRAAPYYNRAYLLYGVLSTRLYLKRDNRQSEHRLTRVIEPLFSLLTAAGMAGYPALELDRAWRMLMKNHPHDSICGCSVDAVHREMQTRTAKLNDICDALVDRAVAACSVPLPASTSPYDPEIQQGCSVVINPATTAISAPVYTRWFEPLGGAPTAAAQSVQIERRRKVDQLFCGWGTVPYYKEVDEVEGWVWIANAPALSLTGVKRNVEVTAPPVVARTHKLSNGLLEVAVGAGGKLSVTDLDSGQIYRLNHTLVDVGDGGDTYNFDPIPDDKPIQARFVDVSISAKGPLVASLRLTYELDLPDAAVPDAGLLTRPRKQLGKIEHLKRSNSKVKHRLTTEILLKRGLPILFFETEFDNQAADHRLQVWFDTELPVKATFSENHFSLVERGHSVAARKDKLPVELGHEAPPDTFPCQRFFIANGQLFLNCGLPEYAVNGKEVGITLLRAVSWLSKPQLWTRGGGAGPNLPTPEANCRGINRCSYGWAPLPGKRTRSAMTAADSQTRVRAYELAELYEGPLTVLPCSRDAGVLVGSLLTFENPAIRATATFVQDRFLLVRLLNVTNERQRSGFAFNHQFLSNPQLVSLSGDSDAGQALQLPFMDFAANQLLTVRFSLSM
jgi:hypothetical protein